MPFMSTETTNVLLAFAAELYAEANRCDKNAEAATTDVSKLVWSNRALAYSAAGGMALDRVKLTEISSPDGVTWTTRKIDE